jgi:hypothetical protein
VPQKIDELTKATQAEDIWNDHRRAEGLFTQLKGYKKQWEPVVNLLAQVTEILELAKEAKGDDVPMLEAEFTKLEKQWALDERVLYFGGKYDLGSAYLSISGGAGGTEA